VNGVESKDCIHCKQILPLTQFGVNGSYNGKQKYKPRCHRCECEYNDTSFYDAVFEAVGGRENYKYVECGYSKCVEALEFHHVDPKTKERAISRMQNYSKEAIQKEIEKCILLCCLCHREFHAGIRKLTTLKG
jgi:hypothetical protein